MSQTSRKVLETLTQDYLWIRAFNSMPQSKLTERLDTSKKQLQHASTSMKQQRQLQQQKQGLGGRDVAATMRGRRGRDPEDWVDAANNNVPVSVEAMAKGLAPVVDNTRMVEWDKAVTQLSDIATEQLAETMIQTTKKHIFS